MKIGKYEKIVQALASWHEAEVKMTDDSAYVSDGQIPYYFVSLTETTEQAEYRAAYFSMSFQYQMAERPMCFEIGKQTVFHMGCDFGKENACRKLLEDYVGGMNNLYFEMPILYEKRGNVIVFRERNPLIEACSIEELELKLVSKGIT